ncbi:MAG: DUF3108 domain-containing protein [Pseudomonadota bacterium]
MPLPSPALANRPPWRLLLLTAVVLLAHWAVLRAAPLALAAHASSDAGSNWAFATRTITTPPEEAPGAAPAATQDVVATPTRPARSKRPAPLAENPVSLQDINENTAPALGFPEQPAIETAAFTATTEAPPATEAPTLLAAATPSPAAGIELAALAAPKVAATPPAAKAVRKFVFPPSARLKYDVKGEIKGFPYHVNGDLQWVQDGKTYNARMEISHFLLGSRVQTSAGVLGAHGLEPTRFGDKVRSEVAAHFDYDKNKVTFSANTPDVPLLPGAQDQLSVMLQIASMLAADPKHFPPASTLSFQAVGPKSAESWIFTVGVTEKLALPGGEMTAVRMSREPMGEFDPRVEVWFAPDVGYLPVRIRLSQANGDVVDQQWKSTQKQ